MTLARDDDIIHNLNQASIGLYEITASLKKVIASHKNRSQNRDFPIIDHCGSSARIELKQNKFSKKVVDPGGVGRGA